MYCVTIVQYTPNLQVQYSTVQYRAVQYTPNLQDDSDANNNDSAGRRLKMEKACEKVDTVHTGALIQDQKLSKDKLHFSSAADITLQIQQSRG